MRNIKYILLIIYVLSLIALGFRPKMQVFYDGFLPSSDIGGWCMYQRFVSNEGILTLQCGESVQRLEWEKYINHGSFTNSAHPKLSKEVMKSFLDFFIKNHLEINQKSNNNDSLVYTFEIVKIIEERDSITLRVSKKIEY